MCQHPLLSSSLLQQHLAPSSVCWLEHQVHRPELFDALSYAQASLHQLSCFYLSLKNRCHRWSHHQHWARHHFRHHHDCIHHHWLYWCPLSPQYPLPGRQTPHLRFPLPRAKVLGALPRCQWPFCQHFKLLAPRSWYTPLTPSLRAGDLFQP